MSTSEDSESSGTGASISSASVTSVGSRMSASNLRLATHPVEFATWSEDVGVLELDWESECPTHIKDSLDCNYFHTCSFPANVADACIASYREYEDYQEDLKRLKTSGERTSAPSDEDLREIDFVHVESILRLCRKMEWASEKVTRTGSKINEATARGAVDDFVSYVFAQPKTSRKLPSKFDFRKEFQFTLPHPTPLKFWSNYVLNTSGSGSFGSPNPGTPTMPPVPRISLATSHAVSSRPIGPSRKQSTLSAPASLDFPSANINLLASTQPDPSSAALVTARQSVQLPSKPARIASSKPHSKRRGKATAGGIDSGTTVTCDTTVFCSYELAPFQKAKGSPISVPAKSLLKRDSFDLFDMPCFVSEYKTSAMDRNIAVRQFLMDSSVVLLNRLEIYGEDAVLGNRAHILHILLGSVVVGDVAEVAVSWLGKDTGGKLNKYTSFSPQKFKLSELSGAYGYWLFLQLARRRALWVDALSKADYSSNILAETVDGHLVGGDYRGPESGGGAGQGNQDLIHGFFNPATWSHRTAAAWNDPDGQGGCQTKEEYWCVAGEEEGWFSDSDEDTDTDSLWEWAEEARNMPAKYLPVEKVPLTVSSLAALSRSLSSAPAPDSVE